MERRDLRLGLGLASLLLAGLLFGAAPSAPAGADDLEGLGEELAKAITEGTFSADARYRFEFVDEERRPDDAYASTLRVRAGYETGSFRDFRLFAEGEAIERLGPEEFNNTRNDETRFPVVADPSDLEVNQLYLAYRGVPETTVTLGRQRIKLDNDRFIGNVGFRQNEQTFDAIKAINASLPDTELLYAFFSDANRIFGEHGRVGDFHMASHIGHASYGGLPFGVLTGYAYLLDFDSHDFLGLSTQTYGGRFVGGVPVYGDDIRILYTGEFAYQSDFRSNPRDYDVNYFLAELGVSAYGVTAKGSLEVLEGTGVSAFQTPLATLHAFQGWTDQFLTTPADGVQDLYQTLGGEVYGVNLLGMHHDFWSEERGKDLGSEWAGEISRTFKIGEVLDSVTVGFIVAHYDAESFATDTDKVWAYLQAKL